MKVLVCHNYYTSKSGEDLVIASDIDILRKSGVQVVEYSRSNAEISHMNVFRLVGALFGVFYSLKTVRSVKALVLKEKPDVAIVQNVFPLISPSIYYCLRRLGVPVIQLVYNYRLVCPNAILYTRGKICERCIKGNFLNAVIRRCLRNSFILSLVYALSLGVHRHMGRLASKINAYVTPDVFLQTKLSEGGLPDNAFFKILNPFDIDAYPQKKSEGKYFVYFGRIVREKGIFTLLAAMEKLPHLKLQIIGAGDAEADARKNVLAKGMTHVEFCGPKYGHELSEVLQDAIAVVVPTEWYDNSPLVVHQAFAMGLPVIASRIDGIPEIVEDGQTGLLFEPGQAEELADKMRLLASDCGLRSFLGANARRKAETEFTAQKRMDGLSKVIKSVICGGQNGES